MKLGLIILVQENIKNIYLINCTVKVKRKKKKLYKIRVVSYLLKKMKSRIFSKK